MIQTGIVIEESLLKRGDKSFAKAAEKVYLGKETKKNSQMFCLTGHSGEIYSVVFSPNGEYLASGSVDDTICL